PSWPAEAERPTIVGGAAGDDVNTNLTFFFVQLLPGTAGPIHSHLRLIEDVVKPRLEAVPGVASVEINAGPPEDLVIRVDPVRAAQYGIALSTIAELAARSDDVSGGFVDVGRRQYTLKLAARYRPEQMGEQILAWRDGRPVRLADVAEVSVERPDRSSATYQNGNPAIGLRLVRAPGANVLGTLDAVQAVVAELRNGVLAEAGLAIEQSYDSALFIRQALSLLGANLGAGVALAIGVLWLFLRNRKTTLLIATTIPLSLLATVLVLSLLGRSLNIISLAGLAFAVGMTLDAAIVVAENILRWRQRGESPSAAAVGASDQVSGALLASTATTVAIFLPVLFLADVEGQMFADLALTIAVAVAMSLLVALTVLPLMSGRLADNPRGSDPFAHLWERISDRLMDWTSSPRRRGAVIAALMGLPISLSALLLPPLDYLPDVKRAAVDAFLNVPPGTSVATVEREV
ncbi:MAG: efflux RND transporter permease subunit, partial [Xanthomonadales bacterium]|nr:efflux RND transporter permease subunit [Xanthomonadales bacterium]